MSNGLFSDEQRKVFTDLGFTFSFDLVGEVTYKESPYRAGRYVVVCADGDVMSITSNNIEEALGTG